MAAVTAAPTYNMLLFFCFTLDFLLSVSCQKVKVHQSPADVLSPAGATASISCRHDNQDYSRILWYGRAGGGHMTLLGLMSVKEAQLEDGVTVKIDGGAMKEQTCWLTTEELKLNGSSHFFCAASGVAEAYFGGGTKLTVLDPDIEVTAPTVRVLRPSSNQTGDDRTLVCVASGFYPDHVSVSWKVDDITRLDGVATDDEATRQKNKFYRITSRLTVPVRVWQNRGRTFSCEVNFFNGTDYLLFSESIRGVKVDSKARAKYLKITQSAKLAYCAFIVKSCVYGAFLVFLLWKLQKSRGKK